MNSVRGPSARIDSSADHERPCPTLTAHQSCGPIGVCCREQNPQGTRVGTDQDHRPVAAHRIEHAPHVVDRVFVRRESTVAVRKPLAALVHHDESRRSSGPFPRPPDTTGLPRSYRYGRSFRSQRGHPPVRRRTPHTRCRGRRCRHSRTWVRSRPGVSRSGRPRRAALRRPQPRVTNELVERWRGRYPRDVSCRSRSGPTSCARGATSASGGSRSAVARVRPPGRGGLAQLRAQPGRAGGARGFVRASGSRASTGSPWNRPRRSTSASPIWRGPRASTTTSSGPGGAGRSTPIASCTSRASAASRTRSRNGCSPATSKRASRSASPRSWRRSRCRPVSTPTRSRRCWRATRTPTRFAPTRLERVEIGITGVPFFLIDGRFPIAGAQDPETMLAVLERAWQRRTPRAADERAPADGSAMLVE